jgi:hypothetical protein
MIRSEQFLNTPHMKDRNIGYEDVLGTEEKDLREVIPAFRFPLNSGNPSDWTELSDILLLYVSIQSYRHQSLPKFNHTLIRPLREIVAFCLVVKPNALNHRVLSWRLEH